YVQRPGFLIRRSIFSKCLGVRIMRQRINGTAARSVANLEFVRRSGKSGKCDEVVVEHNLLHHKRHEGRSATTDPQWRVADSLRFSRTCRQIDYQRYIWRAQQ